MEKTPVLVCGKNSDLAVNLLSKCAEFSNFDLEFSKENIINLNDEADFIVFDEKNAQEISDFSAVIILAVSEDFQTKFLENIKPGGIFIFPENNKFLEDLAENSEKFFRKIPFSSSNFTLKNNKLEADTALGLVELPFDFEMRDAIAGCAVLATQIGLSEENFYESIAGL